MMMMMMMMMGIDDNDDDDDLATLGTKEGSVRYSSKVVLHTVIQHIIML